jgi:hypothetical protein
MRFLLASAGISNKSIHNALVDLLGKPIAASSALCIPTADLENLTSPVDDERRRFLFNVHGDAGVGKTYLTRQLQHIATASGAIVAYVDETVEDVTSAMTVIAGQFGRNGARFSEFEKRVNEYRQRRHELESDPQAPDGIAAFITKTAVTIGLAAARDIPVAESILAPIDATAAADQVNRVRQPHADVTA